MKFERIHVVVLDSVGIGEAPDAAVFGDTGADTLGHIAQTAGLQVPYLTQLGLGNIRPLAGVKAVDAPKGFVGRLQPKSAGKDTMTGHWELMGLVTETPFAVYPEGFPEQLVAQLVRFSGRAVVCNRPYSGTQVIEDYGAVQMKTGALILYTSADPVMQIAAHEETIPLEELYKICAYARSITLTPPYVVGRIIARPFVGEPGHFERTANRHDYAIDPPGETVLHRLTAQGMAVMAVGKINDIFNGQGITQSVSTKSNMDGVDKLLQVMKEPFQGVSFTNLVDFDAQYGHRRDPAGYAQALEDFDSRLPELFAAMGDDDLLVLTADHGNDPTHGGTDHTREYVPLMLYSPALQTGGLLPDGVFADLGALIWENFHCGEGAGPLLRTIRNGIA